MLYSKLRRSFSLVKFINRNSCAFFVWFYIQVQIKLQKFRYIHNTNIKCKWLYTHTYLYVASLTSGKIFNGNEIEFYGLISQKWNAFFKENKKREGKKPSFLLLTFLFGKKSFRPVSQVPWNSSFFFSDWWNEVPWSSSFFFCSW